MQKPNRTKLPQSPFFKGGGRSTTHQMLADSGFEILLNKGDTGGCVFFRHFSARF
jgi:hypothetical protein